jgi:hypothetical protein
MLDPIEQFLAGYPPDVQAISRQLRTTVKASMPQKAKEVLFASHNSLKGTLTSAIR